MIIVMTDSMYKNEDGDYQAINLVAIPITCCDPILHNSSMNDEKMYAVKQL